MNNKEYKKIYTEVQDLINDFGFADPYNIITELKAIFDVDDCDINKTGLVRGKTTYEIHYDDYIVEVVMENYEYKIKDIKEYDDTI